MKNVFNLCMCACVLFMYSCGSSTDLTTEIVGSYIGTYEEFATSSSISVEDITLTVTRSSDETVSFTMPIITLNVNFDGTMETTTEVTIDQATLGLLDVSGSAKLEGTNIKISFLDVDGREVAKYSGTKT